MSAGAAAANALASRWASRRRRAGARIRRRARYGAARRALARRGTGIDAERLIFAGVSLSALFSGVVALVLTRLGPSSAHKSSRGWQARSPAARGEVSWRRPRTRWRARPLGRGRARPQRLAHRRGAGGRRRGRRARMQWLLLAAATLLTAAPSRWRESSVSSASSCRISRGGSRQRRPRRAPGERLLGAALVTWRTPQPHLEPPAEIPLGVLLAFVGVPAFLYLYLGPAGKARLWGAYAAGVRLTAGSRDASRRLVCGRPGQLTAIVGPNGAGKSTFLRALAGVTRLGRASQLDGAAVALASAGGRARGRSRSSTRAGEPALSVREAVATGRFAHQEWWDWRRADAGAAAAAKRSPGSGLDALGGRPFETLSSGERQRA